MVEYVSSFTISNLSQLGVKLGIAYRQILTDSEIRYAIHKILKTPWSGCNDLEGATVDSHLFFATISLINITGKD